MELEMEQSKHRAINGVNINISVKTKIPLNRPETSVKVWNL